MKNKPPQLPRYLSQQRPKKGVSDLLETLFTINRVFDVIHTFQGRKQAEQAARENEKVITEGTISEKLENSKLGTFDDAVEKGYISDFEGGGLYFGMLNGKPVMRRDDWHVICVAMAGAGKSSSICIPNIVTLGMGENPESCFIFDIKGELYKATQHVRHTLDGKEPILIDDFNQLGGGICINYLDSLIIKAQNSEPIVEEALSKLALRYGDTTKRGNNEWIALEAIEWNLGYMLYAAELEPDKCHPPGMADFAHMTHDEMSALFQKIQLCNAGDGAAAETAKNWLSDYPEPNDQFTWIRSEIRTAWSLYGKGNILRFKRQKTDYDFAEMSQEARTVYLHCPPKRMRSHAKDIIAVLDYIIDKIADSDWKTRVTFMADEFINFPPALSTVTALRLYRSEGVRLFVFAQDENGFKAYHDDGGVAPFKENSIGIYFGVDGNIAKNLSEKAGNKSVLIATSSANAGVTNTGGLGSQEVTTPVLPLSDIAQNFKGKAYIDMRDGIYLVDRPAWWEIPEIKELITL